VAKYADAAELRIVVAEVLAAAADAVLVAHNHPKLGAHLVTAQPVEKEISDFEDPARIFQNRHPRPLELVFSRFKQRTIIFLKQNYTKNEPGAQEKRKSVWQMQFSQLPFNEGLSWIVGPCDKFDGPHGPSVCPLFQNKAREPHADALDMYEKSGVKRRRARAAADEARALRQALTATTTATSTTTSSWPRLRRFEETWKYPEIKTLNTTHQRLTKLQVLNKKRISVFLKKTFRIDNRRILTYPEY